MNFASDILRAAIDRSHAVHAEHAETVGNVCNEFADMLKKPWKGRVAAIGEAVVTFRKIVDGSAGADEEKPPE